MNFEEFVYKDPYLEPSKSLEVSISSNYKDPSVWYIKKAVFSGYDTKDVDSIPLESELEENLAVSRDLFRSSNANGEEILTLEEENLSYFKFTDSSMRPDFEPEDFIILEKTDKYEVDSKFYLILYKNNIIVRKVLPNVGVENGFILRASDPDYPELDLRDFEFQFLGKVIKTIKNGA